MRTTFTCVNEIEALFERPRVHVKVKVFQWSFSEAITIFFNRFKSDFILV